LKFDFQLLCLTLSVQLFVDFLNKIKQLLLSGNCKLSPKKLLRAPQFVTMC